MKITSPAFEDGSVIPTQYTCKGQNISPPLNIADVLREAKSLALIMHDPDAIPVVGFDFTHWLVWDIPASTSKISANSLPIGAVQGLNHTKNESKQNSYIGPCPPAGSGSHHYHFKLYALDKTLGLPPTNNREQMEAAMQGHILEQSKLTGLFGE